MLPTLYRVVFHERVLPSQHPQPEIPGLLITTTIIIIIIIIIITTTIIIDASQLMMS